MLQTISQRVTVIALALVSMSTVVTAQPGTTSTATIQADKPGPVISRFIFGQFAEQLGNGTYGGVWVEPDSRIPNVRGIRSDVVQALRALKVPVVRWPGGCFADQYNWRNGIGPADKRRAIHNTAKFAADTTGLIAKAAVGETLTADRIDAINSFGNNDAVMPRPYRAEVKGGKLRFSLPLGSVTVVELLQ